MRKLIIIAALLSGCTSLPAKYQPGEIVQARHWNNHPQYEGETVLIVGFGWRWIKELQGGAMRVYEVKTSDGSHFAAQEFQLKELK